MTAQFGVNFHGPDHQEVYGASFTSTDLTNAADLMALLANEGDQSVRMGLDWWSFQPPTQPGQPAITAFNPNSGTLSQSAFLTYIEGRWPNSGGLGYQNAAYEYSYYYDAYTNGIKVVASFGIVPPWAQVTTPGSQATNNDNAVANANNVGQFIADFVVWMSWQNQGIQTLENIQGIQLFNEVNEVYAFPAAWTQGNLSSIPYNAYFDIVASVMDNYYNALASIHVPLSLAPKIIAPDLAGSYDPAFFTALASYNYATAVKDGVVTTNANVWNSSGQLAIQEIDLHPYGQAITAWVDPTTLAGTSTNSSVIYNLTYNRTILPNMDFMTWRALVNRGSVANLTLYSSAGDPAGDAYFDMNSEIGVERTMADLYQAGDVNVSVTMTEFGAGTYLGDGLLDNTGQADTATFANPYEYGVIAQGQLLTQSMADNLQMVAVMETVGLIRTWSFVTEADVYELYDETEQTNNAGPTTGPLATYGLADIVNGVTVYKPAGLAYNAWLQGQQYDAVANVTLTSPSNTPLNGLAAGFDVHIASSSGAMGSIALNHNQLILLRGPNDSYFSYAGGLGDLVVYADNYNTTLIGGSGYNELYGGAGNDTLIGGSGYNQLVGGAGNDIMQGGAAGNEYVFSEYGVSGSGNSGQDEIVNFNLLKDTLTIVGGYATPLMQNVAGGLLLTLANNGASVFLNNISQAQFVAALNGTANPYVIHGLDSLTQAVNVQNVSSGAISLASSSNTTVNGSSDTIAVALGADLTVNGNTNTINGASNDVLSVFGLSNTVNVSGSSDVVVVGGNASNENLLDTVNMANGGFVYVSDSSRVQVNGSNLTTTIGNWDALGINGSSLTVNATGTGDGVWIGGNSANENLLDTVNISNGTVYQYDSSRIQVNGSNLTTTIGNWDALGINGSADIVNATGTGDGVWIGGNGQGATNANLDTVTLSNGTVYVYDNTRLMVTGSNVTDAIGNNDLLAAYGSSITVNASGTNDQVYIGGNGGQYVAGRRRQFREWRHALRAKQRQGQLYGSNVTANIGASDILGAYGSALTVNASGTGDQVYIGNNGEFSTTANADNVNFASGGAIYENNNSRVDFYGSGVTATIGASDTLGAYGSALTVNASGTGDLVYIGNNGQFSTTANADEVNFASGGSIYENDNSRVDFYGTGVTATIGNNETLGAYGFGLTVNATGTNDQIYIGNNGANTSLDDVVTLANGGSVYENANSRVDVTGFNTTATLSANDLFGLYGANDTITFGSGNSVWLNPGVAGDKLIFGGATAASKVYAFSKGDIINLLGGTGGYTSAAAAFSALKTDGSGGSLLSLGANGSIDIISMAPGSLSAANFKIG